MAIVTGYAPLSYYDDAEVLPLTSARLLSPDFLGYYKNGLAEGQTYVLIKIILERKQIRSHQVSNVSKKETPRVSREILIPHLR